MPVLYGHVVLNQFSSKSSYQLYMGWLKNTIRIEYDQVG